MAPRTPIPDLTLPGTNGGYPAPTVPDLRLPQVNANRSDLAKVEENTQLHTAAIYAHERKAECFIDVNMGTVDKSGDAFSSLTQSSAARLEEAKGMSLEKDIHLAEYSFRQSCLNALDANIRDTARQTGMLATMSVLPIPEELEKPRKGFLARLLS